jgi:hypothetical protein
MKRLVMSLLSFAVLLIYAVTVRVSAATEDYPTKYLPTVEVKINVGNTTIDDAQFLLDLISALRNKGIALSKIDVGYAGSIDNTFPVNDPTQWTSYDHFGEWGEIGGIIDFYDDILTDYVKAHDTNWDSYYYVDGYNFDPLTYTFSIDYCDDDSGDCFEMDYTMSSLKDANDEIHAHFLQHDINGNISSLQDEAIAIIEAQPGFAGYQYVNWMWYDAATQKSYFSYYDIDWNYFELEFPVLKTYLSTPNLINGYTLTNFDYGDDYGAFEYSNGSDSFNVDFSATYWGGTDSPSHYPEPDTNPDGDNPVDWTNDMHIVTHDDGSVTFYGYGEPAFKDFMLSKDNTVSDKSFKFDLDGSAVDYHSMEGGGFLFSIETDDQGTTDVSDDLMSGYGVLFTQDETILYRLNETNIADFHDEYDEAMEDSSGVTVIGTYDKDDTTDQHYIQIDIVNNVLTVKDNDVVAIDGYTLEVVGNRFGPLVSYESHGCEQLSWFVYDNLKMGSTIKVVSKAQDNVSTIEWTTDAYPVYINLEDTNDVTLDATTFAAALKEDGADYIGAGLTVSKTMHDAIVAANGKGLYYELTEPVDTKVLASAIADYLWPLLEPKTIDNIENAVLESVVNSTLPVKPVITIPEGVIDAFDDLAAGDDVKIELDIDLIESLNVPEDDLQLVNTYINGLANHDKINVYYLDMSLFKVLNGTEKTQLTEILKPITIKLTLPAVLWDMTDFSIIRVHNGVVEKLNVTLDPVKHTLTFTTDKFSTYGIQYTNTNGLPDTGVSADAGAMLLFIGAGLWLISRSKKHA